MDSWSYDVTSDLVKINLIRNFYRILEVENNAV